MVILLFACADPDGVEPAATDEPVEETGSPDSGDSTVDTQDSAPDTDDTADTDDSAAPLDADGDGWAVSDDCDDGRASVHPGAFDQCDTIDQDCDGSPIAPGACAEQGALEAGALWVVDHAAYVGGGAFMIGDVTGDGAPDLLDMTASWYTVFPGGPVPAAPWALPEDGYHSIGDLVWGAGLQQVETGDVDGDGIEDLGVVSILEDMGVHLFVGPFSAGGTTSMADDHVYVDPGVRPDYLWGVPIYGAVDFDGDGRADLIADNDDSLGWTYSVYFGGEWDTACLLGDTENGSLWVYEDLDGDGLADAYLSGSPDGFVSGADLRSSCGGPIEDLAFASRASHEAWGSPTSIGDWNGDGWMDLVMGDPGSDTAGLSAGEIYFFTGPYAGELRLDDAVGSWTGREALDSLGTNMTALDFDGDGVLDVYTGGTGWSQRGVCAGGRFPAPHEPRPDCLLVESHGEVPWHRTSDFNGDGYDDLFVESDDGTLTGIFPGFAVPWDDPTYW